MVLIIYVFIFANFNNHVFVHIQMNVKKSNLLFIQNNSLIMLKLSWRKSNFNNVPRYFTPLINGEFYKTSTRDKIKNQIKKLF